MQCEAGIIGIFEMNLDISTEYSTCGNFDCEGVSVISGKFRKTSVVTMGLFSLVNGGLHAARAADLPLDWQPPPRKSPPISHAITPVSPSDRANTCNVLQTLSLEQQVAFLKAHPECVPDTTIPPDPQSESTPGPTEPVVPTIEPTNPTQPTEPQVQPTNPVEPQPTNPTEPP